MSVQDRLTQKMGFGCWFSLGGCDDGALDHDSVGGSLSLNVSVGWVGRLLTHPLFNPNHFFSTTSASSIISLFLHPIDDISKQTI